jgi:hypothetical protein
VAASLGESSHDAVAGAILDAAVDIGIAEN